MKRTTFVDWLTVRVQGMRQLKLPCQEEAARKTQIGGQGADAEWHIKQKSLQAHSS